MEGFKLCMDCAAVGTWIAAVAGWLPPIAALLSVIWLSIQIYDRLNRGSK